MHFAMRRLAVLSMHTSPLAQPGTGDGGGMNVYVRELSAALARAGVACDVFTRSVDPALPEIVEVEPGFRLHHVAAGPLAPLPKGVLHNFIGEFTDAVETRLSKIAAEEVDAPEAIHANYWLSGVAGHALKHRLGLPLVSTFHTLDRVKAEASPEEVDTEDPERRARAEAEVIGCSDVVLASCEAEVSQLVQLYGADPARIGIIAPGVDHAFFSPGDKAQARRAIGYTTGESLVLFVGRIQPLKGLEVAVRAMGSIDGARCRLLVIGGPSGPSGAEEVAAVRVLVERLGLSARVDFLPPQRHEALSTFYRAADVCIVPSMSESFGLVALEAAACGTPVIASAVGGLTSLVEDGVNGFLVEPRDVEGFARRLGELVTDELRAAQMGVAGARRAAAYTWPAAAATLHALYDEITTKSLVECG
jgi:D-inositol-3-phosphate glycosyltransferase